MRDPEGPSRHIVTSSDLVRHFGYWQDRAARAPIYVLHRGRPRLVLTSVEIMDALCAPHSSGQTGCSPDLAAVLDRIADRVLIADEFQRIVAASVNARRDFGTLADAGAALSGLVAERCRAQLVAAADRVLRTGVAMALDLSAWQHPERSLNLVIDTWPGGLMLVAGDVAETHDDAAALEAATAANDIAATALIDADGRLEGATSALAWLCQRSAAALSGTQFAALFEAPAPIRDAIDRVIATTASVRLDAALRADRETALAVRIGLAPRHAGLTKSGVAAMLVVSAG
ncbi:hypothetical protein BH10PSE15_BH10PSE15_06380 [soil metagenome]